jgi:hypothetical protein
MGIAKLYYLKEYSGLHQRDSSYHGKNISIGIGVSDLENGYDAAVSAAKQAAMQSSQGGSPTFSIVFVSSKYNKQIEKVVKGINNILGTNWIGCTTDREINSVLGFSEGTVEVLCLDTPYMHFGVGLAENYRKNPIVLGKNAISTAISNCPVERSGFATAQFMRGTKKGFAEIVKNPPYFILSFIGGPSFKNGAMLPGREVEFLEGIMQVVGSSVPIFGGSATNDFNEIVNYKGENYVFANGKACNNGAVVCFVVSELAFSCGLDHGYSKTDKFGIITRCSGEGRVIEELNGKPALTEYCKIAGIKAKDFLKNPFYYSVMSPICMGDVQENIYPKVLSARSFTPKETALAGSEKFSTNTAVIIGTYNQKKTVGALERSITQALADNNLSSPVVALSFCCSVQRFLLRDKIRSYFTTVKQKYPDLGLFGYFTAGEIGGKKNLPSTYNNITSVSLVIFDKLLVE